jgi:predicted acetyltransferase
VVQIRFITEDEVVDYRTAVAFGFGLDLPPDDGDKRDLYAAIRPASRSIAAFDRDRMVATFAGIDFDLTVPGGTVAMAGTTSVTVHPTHRRRGLLTEMMRLHLDQAVERGQPVAGLWASEEQIYGRFGYGQACTGVDTTIPGNLVNVPPGPSDVTVRFLSADEVPPVLEAVYEQVRPQVPGLLSRTDAWWKLRHLLDPADRREGASARRFVVAERADKAVGYVTYRHKQEEGDIPGGRVEIGELVAVDDEARRALWHYATNVDLYPVVHWWNAPIDDPVAIEADRFRAVTRKAHDTLWLRLLDVHESLEARGYERDGSLVLDVEDRFLGRGGTFSLEVSGGVASCKPSTATPDIELGVQELSGLYLGGTSAVQLARAGRLSGSPAAVRTIDDVFRTSIAPHCIEVF